MFYTLGVKEIGTGLYNKNVSKSESFNISPIKSSGITLEIQPSGHVILGKKGVTLTCITGPNQNISWLHNGIPAPPCGIARCTILKNGSLHLHKVQIEKFYLLFILKLNQLSILFYCYNRWCKSLKKKTLLQLTLKIITKMNIVV